ncbi:hypothetical protein F5877DRAFT_71411 [Lentinula edodes]|nr:hypothetical protein F5877DRAFT_71411 [Lentinula edodes]
MRTGSMDGGWSHGWSFEFRRKNPRETEDGRRNTEYGRQKMVNERTAPRVTTNVRIKVLGLLSFPSFPTKTPIPHLDTKTPIMRMEEYNESNESTTTPGKISDHDHDYVRFRVLRVFMDRKFVQFDGVEWGEGVKIGGGGTGLGKTAGIQLFGIRSTTPSVVIPLEKPPHPNMYMKSLYRPKALTLSEEWSIRKTSLRCNGWDP